MADYIAILSRYYNGKNWSMSGEDYSGLQWTDSSEKPTKEELEAKGLLLQSEKTLEQYKRDRAAAYPSIVDQLDTLYHGGYDAWKATIEAVKNQYPKP